MATFAIFFCCLLGTVMAASLQEHPNIIFVHVDRMDGRTALSDSAALTPNIDKLAERGVRFDNTYCASPECVPSRSAIWSGRRTDQTGAWSNGHGLPYDYPIIMDRVAASGYETKFIGRHDFNSGHHSLSANLSSWTRAVPDFAIPSEERPKARIEPSQNVRVHEGDWKNSDACVKWLQDRLSNSTRSATPFMLSCGFSCPHPAYVTSQYWYNNGVNHSAIQMPKLLPEERMHPVQRYETITKNCSGDWAEEEVRAIRATYYAMVAEADAFVGQIFSYIEKSSYAANTVIFFWSDHGDMTMEHNQYYKETTLEGSARVPLVIAGPVGYKKGVVQKRPTSLIDLFPTVMDLTRTQHPPGLAGFSLAPDVLVSSELRPNSSGPVHPDWVLCQAHMDHSNTGQFMVRQNNWKYIEYVGYDPQLFDLDEDPGELKNLAEQNPDVVKQLRDILTQQLDPLQVDKVAKKFDKDAFLTWKNGLGDKYQSTIGSRQVRWYPTWHKNPDYYLSLIDKWLKEP